MPFCFKGGRKMNYYDEIKNKLIDNEYKIKFGDTYNYIDLLLFNIEYNCYVVVELKATELKRNI